jgi:hypothetical protein
MWMLSVLPTFRSDTSTLKMEAEWIPKRRINCPYPHCVKYPRAESTRRDLYSNRFDFGDSRFGNTPVRIDSYISLDRQQQKNPSHIVGSVLWCSCWFLILS